MQLEIQVRKLYCIYRVRLDSIIIKLIAYNYYFLNNSDEHAVFYSHFFGEMQRNLQHLEGTHLAKILEEWRKVIILGNRVSFSTK